MPPTSLSHNKDLDRPDDRNGSMAHGASHNAAPARRPQPLPLQTDPDLYPSSQQEQPFSSQQPAIKTRRRRGSLRKVALLGRGAQRERREANIVESSAVTAAAAAASTAASPFSSTSASPSASGSGPAEDGYGLGISDITPRPSMDGYASRAASAAAAAALLSPTPKSAKQASKLLPRDDAAADRSGHPTQYGLGHSHKRSTSGSLTSPGGVSYSTTDDEDVLHMSGKSGGGGGGGAVTSGGGLFSTAAAAAAAAATSILRKEPQANHMTAASPPSPEAYLTGPTTSEGGSSSGARRLSFTASFQRRRQGSTGAQQQQSHHPQQQQQQQRRTSVNQQPPSPTDVVKRPQQHQHQEQQPQKPQPPQPQPRPQPQHQIHHQPQPQPLQKQPPLQQHHHQGLHHPLPQPHLQLQQPPAPKQRAKSPLALSDLSGTTAAAAHAVTTTTSLPPSATLVDDDWDYAETAWWGWVLLAATWVVFVVGMGSCLGVWSWAWDVGTTPYAPPELEDDPTLPIVGYYPALIILTGVMAWVWVVVAWIGMKYFRHAKISGD